MKVTHLHLMVPDVRASVEFFEKDFDLRNGGGNAGLDNLFASDDKSGGSARKAKTSAKRR